MSSTEVSYERRLENLRRFCEQSVASPHCTCEELMMDDEPCGAVCPYCTRQAKLRRAAQVARRWAAKQAARPLYAAECASISAKMTRFHQAKSRRLRIRILGEVFSEILACPGLCASSRNFRHMVGAKIIEFRAAPQAEALFPILKKVEDMLATLHTRADYQA